MAERSVTDPAHRKAVGLLLLTALGWSLGGVLMKSVDWPPLAVGGGRRELKRAGGRVFALDQGVWTDLNRADSLRVLTVAPFSPAYFAVLRALPEIGPSLTVGDAVLVAGQRASLKVAAGGRDRLDPAELQVFVRAFKGVS